MSLFQVFFDRYSPEYLAHYDTYQQIIDNRDFKQDSLLNELGNTLTVKEYKEERSKAWTASKKELGIYTKKKKELAAEHSFRGRSNFKFWIFQFGLILLGFYFSVKSLVDDLKRKIKTGHELISIVGISISLLWFYHLIFQTAKDFYTETYLFAKFLAALAVGFFISRLIKYYVLKTGIIQSLIDLIIRIKKVHYKEMVIKALYAEKYDRSIDSIETVKNQTERFDQDVKETIKNII
ncbi:hypothetical protein [Tenacibaculum geojense]|uniref:Uncharacterized protein n=1 Tax=Tenacibaculum geojense TaxID=915352 RepID=A0ABW3JPE2_9FLAO